MSPALYDRDTVRTIVRNKVNLIFENPFNSATFLRGGTIPRLVSLDFELW